MSGEDEHRDTAGSQKHCYSTVTTSWIYVEETRSHSWTIKGSLKAKQIQMKHPDH